MGVRVPCVYVVEVLSEGVAHGVKIGVSRRWQDRVAAHRTLAANYGCEVGRVWISNPHLDAWKIEARLVSNLGDSLSARTEFFRLPFDRVVQHVQLLMSDEYPYVSVPAVTEGVINRLLKEL